MAANETEVKVRKRMAEVRIANGTQKPSETPHETDTGNAIRLVDRYGDDLRYCHPWKKWHCWDGTRWRLDDSGQAMRWTKDTIKALFKESATEIARIGRQLQETEDEEEQAELKKKLDLAKKLLAWALKSEDSRRLSAMQALAQSDRPILPAQLDNDSYLLCCPNGTLDLRTGELRPHRREDYITQLCPTPYDPKALCPTFERAVWTIMHDDGGLVTYIQRFLGHALTGDVSEQTLPIWWGSGANGKSTLINALLYVMGGDYAGMVPPELLIETRGEQHPTILASLFRKRLQVAAETGQGRKLNIERMKVLTGGDEITARRMREDFWKFIPTHKLILVTNHKPQIEGDEHANWRRLRLVPFTVRFLDPEAPENADSEIPIVDPENWTTG